MNTDKAKEELNAFIDFYNVLNVNGKYDGIKEQVEATKTLLEHCNWLEKEVSNLAIESLGRDKKLAKLEAEVDLIRSE